MEYKLGKLPAVIDRRTIKLSAILRAEQLPPLPETFCVDESVNGVEDNFMYNNSTYGDCVIAARAHQTLRFEKFEQGYQIPITDEEVVDQYFKETGGPDVGLYLLSSLKSWRNDGWTAGGQHHKIYAFAGVDWKDHEQVKHCIHLLGGVNFGMRIYKTDMNQFSAGEDWYLTGSDGALQGGHGVYLYAYGYDDEGITCMTWGRRQRMTWSFWDARIDEAYGIVDNANDWLGEDSPVDVEKLDSYLKEITQDVPQKEGCLFAPLALRRLLGKLS